MELDLLGVPLALQLPVVRQDLVDHFQHVARPLLQINILCLSHELHQHHKFGHRYSLAKTAKVFPPKVYFLKCTIITHLLKLCEFTLLTVNLTQTICPETVVIDIQLPGNLLQDLLTWVVVEAPEKQLVNTSPDSKLKMSQIESYQKCLKLNCAKNVKKFCLKIEAVPINRSTAEML